MKLQFLMPWNDTSEKLDFKVKKNNLKEFLELHYEKKMLQKI
jgi:hypothetical protein